MGNPYLDQSHRNRDRQLLMLGMLAPRPDTHKLLEAYTVTHLLAKTSELPLLKEAPHWFPKEVYHDSDFVLLAR